MGKIKNKDSFFNFISINFTRLNFCLAPHLNVAFTVTMRGEVYFVMVLLQERLLQVNCTERQITTLRLAPCLACRKTNNHGF